MSEKLWMCKHICQTTDDACGLCYRETQDELTRLRSELAEARKDYAAYSEQYAESLSNWRKKLGGLEAELSRANADLERARYLLKKIYDEFLWDHPTILSVNVKEFLNSPAPGPSAGKCGECGVELSEHCTDPKCEGAVMAKDRKHHGHFNKPESAAGGEENHG